MHRPISKSGTATEAVITARVGAVQHQFEHPLTLKTYDYVAHTERSSEPFEFVGRISSYNINTFKGRVYVAAEGRPIPFELADSARNTHSILAVATSLRANAQIRAGDGAEIHFNAFRNTSHSGRLKGLLITEIL